MAFYEVDPGLFFFPSISNLRKVNEYGYHVNHSALFSHVTFLSTPVQPIRAV